MKSCSDAWCRWRRQPHSSSAGPSGWRGLCTHHRTARQRRATMDMPRVAESAGDRPPGGGARGAGQVASRDPASIAGGLVRSKPTHRGPAGTLQRRVRQVRIRLRASAWSQRQGFSEQRSVPTSSTVSPRPMQWSWTGTWRCRCIRISPTTTWRTSRAGSSLQRRGFRSQGFRGLVW